MRYSRFLLPVLKENPQEAQIVSHRLMLRAGMIRQLASGIYNWLPLGHMVLKNIAEIVRKEMDHSGALEVLMPTMQPAELWQESGRGNYGKETLIAIDRHEKQLIYGPTNEEVITDLFRKNVKSYKELPLNLYHIQWKFRDEIRPRFGVMRGREFLMKDAYSFDIDEAAAKESYNRMYETYFRIFKRMGLRVIPFVADTGAIGGSMSHEFQVVAETGESQIYYDEAFEDLVTQEHLDITALQKLYSAADEKHDPKTMPIPAEKLRTARGIEVGHIFYLGEKYSAAMGATITDPSGKEVVAKMGCYGIGVSRLVGAIIEANHDERGIIWPDAVAPFHVSVINLKTADETCTTVADDFYHALQQAGVSVLLDDRAESAGAKFATHDLIGSPWTVAIGPRGVEAGTVEVKRRHTGEKQEISVEAALALVSQLKK